MKLRFVLLSLENEMKWVASLDTHINIEHSIEYKRITYAYDIYIYTPALIDVYWNL